MAKMLRNLTLAGLLLAAGACGSGSPGATDTEVTLRLIAFSPEMLEVERGTTVRWTNTDDSEHTVRSGTVDLAGSGEITTKPDDRFVSERLTKDASFSHTFEDADTYAYFCEIHPATMQGRIEVQR